MMHPRRRLGIVHCTASLSALVPAVARAEVYICANFFATANGTYGDQLGLIIAGETSTATAHGITGLHLAETAGSECTTYTLSQVVARLDFDVVGVDPGETVSLSLNGAAYPLSAEELHLNPWVTSQPLTLSGGELQSAGADGSAYLEVGIPGLSSFEICASAAGATGGVVVRVVINSFCQCGNGNKHFNEDCDDGAFVSGDGCSDECVVEDGWSCNGNPSVCEVEIDGGVPVDAASELPDAALPPPDAALPPPDAALPPPDAALPPPDAALPPPDAALPPIDAMPPPDDADPGIEDAGQTADAAAAADAAAPTDAPIGSDYDGHASDDALATDDAGFSIGGGGGCGCQGSGGAASTGVTFALAALVAVLVPGRRRRRATVRR